MNKKEVINALAEKTGLTKKDCEAMLTAFIEVVTESLVEGETVNVIGLGKFSPVLREARTGRNPRTGEEITIEEAVVPRFKPSKALKEALR